MTPQPVSRSQPVIRHALGETDRMTSCTLAHCEARQSDDATLARSRETHAHTVVHETPSRSWRDRASHPDSALGGATALRALHPDWIVHVDLCDAVHI